MTQPRRHWIYLASALEAAEVVSGVRGAHEDVPPAGTELHQAVTGDVSTVMPPLSGLRLPFYVTGVSDYPDPDDWSHTTLGAFIAEVGLNHAAWVARLASIFDATVGRIVSLIDQWPVIVKGTGEGNEMRWVKSTVKGTLGGVEDFQFSVNFSKPGADPNPDAAALAALGVSLNAKFVAALSANDALLGNVPRSRCFSPDVKFTAFGAALLTITEAKDKDGGGGNLSQDGETQWSLINGVTGIVGTTTEHSLPYEVATCVTMHTDHAGPSGRGRVYLPPPSINALDTGGKYLANQVVGAAHILSAWFTAVIAGADDVVPVVVSQRRLFYTPISQVTVGIIPDSQRRRRWSQLESPQVAWTA